MKVNNFTKKTVPLGFLKKLKSTAIRLNMPFAEIYIIKFARTQNKYNKSSIRYDITFHDILDDKYLFSIIKNGQKSEYLLLKINDTLLLKHKTI